MHIRNQFTLLGEQLRVLLDQVHVVVDQFLLLVQDVRRLLLQIQQILALHVTVLSLLLRLHVLLPPLLPTVFAAQRLLQVVPVLVCLRLHPLHPVLIFPVAPDLRPFRVVIVEFVLVPHLDRVQVHVVDGVLLPLVLVRHSCHIVLLEVVGCGVAPLPSLRLLLLLQCAVLVSVEAAALHYQTACIGQSIVTRAWLSHVLLLLRGWRVILLHRRVLLLYRGFLFYWWLLLNGQRVGQVLRTLAGVFLESARVSEGVESVVGTGTAWRYACEHDDSDSICVHHERVPQHHGQFAGSERNVRVYAALLHVETADALLQSQQALIDFSAFQSPLSVVALAIRGPFTASQVHQ